MKQYLQPEATVEFALDDICTISTQSTGIGDTKDYSEVVKNLFC